jgi:ankyrin repeat protein
MNAIERGDVRDVKEQLDSGTDPNAYPNQDEDDLSPLNFAVERGNRAAIKLLLDHHADPNIQDGYHYNPLAAAEDHPEVMPLLLSYGAQVNDSEGNSWALYRVAMDGKPAAVAFLLAHGANPNTHIRTNPLLPMLKDTPPEDHQVIALLRKAGAKE